VFRGLALEIFLGGIHDGTPHTATRHIVVLKCLFRSLLRDDDRIMAMLVDEQPGYHPYFERVNLHAASTYKSGER